MLLCFVAGKMLRFEGFYFEESFAWGYSRRAVHPVKLCYYLEDDTISVHEPVTPVSIPSFLPTSLA